MAGKNSYRRLVTVQAGVMVSFEADEALDEKEQSSYAETVAADAISRAAAIAGHPLGVTDAMSRYVRPGVSISPTDITADIVLVEDEGDWS